MRPAVSVDVLGQLLFGHPARGGVVVSACLFLLEARGLHLCLSERLDVAPVFPTGRHLSVGSFRAAHLVDQEMEGPSGEVWKPPLH